MIELLAPAGDSEKLETAIHFGADAVYFAGKNYGLRAYSTNIENDDIKTQVDKLHKAGKKAYVTINIFARNKDFEGLAEYLKILSDAKVDAVIVSDLGVFQFIKEHQPNLCIHVSTQANTTNKYTAKMWESLGASRIILARELTIEEIKEIKSFLNKETEIECFVHGAMCISYSGRCLLSNYLTGRESNRGECVQCCRWKYKLVDETGKYELGIAEDANGTYFLNSKDLCLIEHLDELIKAGVTSFKIEGRMKSPYYVATVVNAYRRALNVLQECEKTGKKFIVPEELKTELLKASHREYTTGYTFDKGDNKQNYKTSSYDQNSVFLGVVRAVDKQKGVLVEQRNRFKNGDVLEVLSPTQSFNKTFVVGEMTNEKGKIVDDAKNVQERLWIKMPMEVEVGDILRSLKK